jgi:hypothetical protein
MDRKTVFPRRVHREEMNTPSLSTTQGRNGAFPRRVHREEINIPTQSTWGRNEHSHAEYIGKI